MKYQRLFLVSYCDIVNILITGQVLHNTFVTDEECSCDEIFTLLLKQGFASPTVEFSHWPQQFHGNTSFKFSCTALLNKNR